MYNILEHHGVKARIVFDPEIELFRGEILGLSGSADFYAADVNSLKSELETSLDTYIEVCKERNIEPYKSYNGRILFRTKSETHQKLEALAVAKGISVNKLLDKMVENEISAMN